MNECEKWLAEILSQNVFMNCETIRIKAKEKGFSKGQLSAAKKVLRVITFNDSALHGGKAQNWFWLIIDETKEEQGNA